MYRISEWTNYQHYGDKKQVPWIKLHYRLLTSEAWMMLDDPHKCLMITCMLHASENKNGSNGEVTKSLDYLVRLGNIKGKVSFKPLIDIGFLEPIELVKTSLDNSRINQNESSESYSLSSSYSLSEKGGVGGKTENGYTEEFLNFWKTYPPNKGSKQDAFKSYQKAVKGTNHDEIIRGAAAYAADCAASGTEIQFIKHPATWLNKRCWEIDYSAKITPQRSTSKFIGTNAAAEIALSRIVARAAEADRAAKW